MATRSPIVSVLGHVDHGKSSILDAIRGSKVVSGEAGGITQAIGASIMPIEHIRKRCGDLIRKLGMTITIPGILFIDTPGHVAFTSLRKRGGSLADIAILVVDVNEGLMPQTVEAIDILKTFKTPFLIAANKIDIIKGFRKTSNNFLQCFSAQSEETKQAIDMKLYELVGSLYEKFALSAERFDRIEDYTKQIAIIPCSAKAEVGLEEILMVLTGLAQKYLEQGLKLNVDGPAKGIILEVKDDKGLGRTMDTIIYDGSLRVGETIVIGTVSEPIQAKVKALLMPEPLTDMRDRKSRFTPVKEATAATGVKISCSELDERIIAGMPVLSVKGLDVEDVMRQAKSQIDEVTIDTNKSGIIIKADTLGSLEALLKMLADKSIPVRKASIGNITRKDVSDAESNHERDPFSSVILGFNVKQEQSTERVEIIVRDVIYALIDDFDAWQKKKREELEAKELDAITRPAKLEVLRNCMFRQSNPCIVGIEVIEGKLRAGTRIMDKEGRRVGEIKSMESEKQTINVAERGRQVAASIPGATAGRQIVEGDVYYADLDEDEYRKLKKLAKYLMKPEKDVLKEFVSIKRKQNPVWGV